MNRMLFYKCLYVMNGINGNIINLFSNILKYGDKSSPVFIKGSFTKQSYILEISNTVKQQNTGVESNHIGLMSVEKMMHQLGGESTFSEKNGSFSVELKFSLVH